ncbi:branched-chain amino acid transporter permease [Blautia sp. HCP3S3_G3]|uniref:branched-chain amino acid transporter permease n=1 Tax=Blautia sp. HCP3S3_G3 TaxID=3438913 RepID=UPI003F8B9615
MIDVKYSLMLILVIGAVTQLLRFLPFAVFSRGTPRPILYLGNVLPSAIMAMLVVYCLKNTSFTGPAHGIPEIVSALLVVVLHKWKHNTLLSIVSGTVCYMLFVQVLF